MASNDGLYIDLGGGLWAQNVSQTGRKVSLAIGAYDQVLNVAAGASSTITITPPVGELWRIKTLYIDTPPPTGATAGTHSFSVGIGPVNNGKSFLLLAKSNHIDRVRTKFNVIELGTATDGKFPISDVAQNNAILGMVVTNAAPLTIFYTNSTTGGTQNGTIAIQVTREVEYIV